MKNRFLLIGIIENLRKEQAKRIVTEKRYVSLNSIITEGGIDHNDSYIWFAIGSTASSLTILY